MFLVKGRMRGSSFCWQFGLLLSVVGCTDAPTVAPWRYVEDARPDAASAVGPDAGGGGDASALDSGAPDAGDPLAQLCREHAQMRKRAALRRLSRMEYSNTLRDLLGDTTSPGSALPSEPIGNNFGNDASKQSVSSLLVEQYGTVAEAVAARATATPEALRKLAPCTKNLTAANELACAKSTIERVARRGFRRPLATDELDELVQLWQDIRGTGDFGAALATVLEAVLQSPDFLYRIELGQQDPDDPNALRPTGFELATRLSYTYWGTMPDDALLMAAEAGQLSSPEQVRIEAERLLAARERSRTTLRFFFDSLLPISGLTSLTRDSKIFPQFSPQIGALLREETLQYVEREIFDDNASWPAMLTEPYTYLNEPLAAFYGVSGVVGSDFRRVALDGSQRLGLLTQAGVLAGTTHSNLTSPVLRGSFIVQRLLCRSIPLPTGEILAKIKPPEPTSGLTGRDRYTAHSSDAVCRGCHQYMDPVGFALENYDAIGLFRSEENGAPIDPSGVMPDGEGGEMSFAGPIELVRELSQAPEVNDCFATNWMTYAYGLDANELDECTVATVNKAFKESDYSVRTLLLSLAQTDAFLYLANAEGEP